MPPSYGRFGQLASRYVGIDRTGLFVWYLRDMPNKPHSDREYITPAEAHRIAYLSTKQLARLADDGKIASIRPGRRWRYYLRADVEALVKDSAA